MLDNQICQNILEQGLKLHKAGNFAGAIGIYNKLLNRGWADNGLRFVMADALMRVEHNGIAINLLQGILRDDPMHSQAWCNLGVALRSENFNKEAREAWMKAIETNGSDTIEVCHNMAGLYADSGDPEHALYWCDRGLKIDPNYGKIHWHRALALLTLGKFREGWEQYERRFLMEDWDSRKQIDVPHWDGAELPEDAHLYLHGEQGVGDEIFFLRWLDDALRRAPRITVEVNEKVASAVSMTWPGVSVVTSAKQAVENQPKMPFTHKLPLGSLPRIFWSGKPAESFLDPAPSLVRQYRAKLEELGPGPYVAVTWLGGCKRTNVENRSMPAACLKPLQEAFTCVSGQYETGNPLLAQERVQAGLAKLDDQCIGGDLGYQAALFAACDYVVTVAQTALHVAGAVGTPCYVLLPDHPDWRFGGQGERSPYYASLRLVRKAHAKTWDDKIAYVMQEIKNDANLRKLQTA